MPGTAANTLPTQRTLTAYGLVRYALRRFDVSRLYKNLLLSVYLIAKPNFIRGFLRYDELRLWCIWSIWSCAWRLIYYENLSMAASTVAYLCLSVVISGLGWAGIQNYGLNFWLTCA